MVNKLKKASYVYKAVSKILAVFMVMPLHIVYFFSKYVPRSKRKWVFSSWEGMAMRGNSKYLFEYISSNKDIEVVWVTKNKELMRKCTESGINIKYGYAIGGIYSLMTGSVIFVSHGINDVVPYFTRGAIVVNLGHATYSLKNMSFYAKLNSLNFCKRLYHFAVSPYDYVDPSYEVVVSKGMLTRTMYLDYLDKKNKGKIVPLGLPKTDVMLEMQHNCKADVARDMLMHEPFYFSGPTTLILFLPTWRQNKEYNLFDYNFDGASIDNVLERNNAVIVVNFHPFDENIRKNNNGKISDRVYSVSQSGEDIMKLLCASDIFITDYSSLFSDYIIYNRPIIFAKFAYDKYVVEERALSVEYDSLPGEIVTDWQGLTNALVRYLDNQDDIYCKARREWRDKIYSGTDDGMSSERIYSFIKDDIQ